ncbi:MULTISPECIES: hypothetical protein [Veillonella]|uniref:hypothetical protein n=1 Tax=Veillonella TaxID=29465 RepID=UPI001D65DC7B|nr:MULTISPECIES: hypothetical protein [Veillonella]MBS6962683.1 hypothetical protein [Veillonella sp.]MDU2039785.1 hypothetical protein [Veillonella parvula]MDU6637545.1 hypothetical protein [Veillonella parvula]
MKQTELGAAIESAKGEATEVKTVKVDIFDIPETKVEEYIANREEVAEAAAQVMKSYCVTVKRETLDPEEGEAVVGYYITDEILMCVILDPFEVPVMKVALDKGTLKDYILAANDLTEDMLASLEK